MTKRLVFGRCAAAAPVCAPNPLAQEREDRTLLSPAQMRAMVSEAPGERAMHHVMERVPYPRIRPIAEYQDHFRERQVAAVVATGAMAVLATGGDEMAARVVWQNLSRGVVRLVVR